MKCSTLASCRKETAYLVMMVLPSPASPALVISVTSCESLTRSSSMPSPVLQDIATAPAEPGMLPPELAS